MLTILFDKLKRALGGQKHSRMNSSDAALALIGDRETHVSSIELCTLSVYKQFVSCLPKPTDEQISNFIHYVSEAHSWYKHLPLLPPGVNFRFFVDPFSGYDSALQPGGGIAHEERTEDSTPFHYTWMTTKAYRSQFGYLSYAASAGVKIFLKTEEAVREYVDRPVFSTSERQYRVPEEIAEVGTVELTAIIHRLAGRSWVWTYFLPRLMANSTPGPSRNWPTETGGDVTLRKITELSSEQDRDDEPLDGPDPELDLLLLPERSRLQDNMTQAINRMLELIY